MTEPMPQARGLRRVMLLDAWLSFTAPVLIGTIPLLRLLSVPDEVVTAAVLTVAGILGGCGVLIAARLAISVARGAEFPDADVLHRLRLVDPAEDPAGLK